MIFIRSFYPLLLLLTLLLNSCKGEQIEKSLINDSGNTEEPIITFAVAGHVYGNSDHYTHSIYPSFLKKFREDDAARNFDYLFLTGDVVYDTTFSTSKFVEAQLDSLNISWFIAQGNHDLQTLFDKKLNDRSDVDMNLIRYRKNEFLVFNTSKPGWSIGKDEMLMLKHYLSNVNPDSTDNIFVFTHQLWWERNTPHTFELYSIRPNSFALYDGPSDFWKDVFPSFDSTGIETWFFAGDVGADEKLESYYEDQHNQFHFYASGMGGGKADNYLIVEVYQNGHVDIERVNF